MNKIKAIVLDMDGTLLSSKKIITEQTKVALIAAQEAGVKVILASGRPTSGMIRHAKELNMDQYDGLLVSFNGSMVTDVTTNEVLYNRPLSVENSKAILEHLKKFEVIPMVTKDDYLYVNDVYAGMLKLGESEVNIIEYESRGGNYKLCEKEDLAEFVDRPLNKILVAGDAEYLLDNHLAIMEPFNDLASGMFSAPFYFEFTEKGIDKAKALDTVLKSFEITPEEIISFGDGHNDRSIIEYAGIGVAMGNAVDEIKAIANEVTASNDEDGIALILKKYQVY